MTKIPDIIHFLHPVSSRKLSKGAILIAEPMMYDHYFTRSVILLIEHNEEGSVGFVLNNFASPQTETTVAQATGIHAPIGIGGPVDPQMLCFLHTLGTLVPNAAHVIGNIHSGGDFKAITQLLNEGTINYSQLRFFMGYSGWGAGQLEDEINNHTWTVGSLPPETLFAINKKLWIEAVKILGSAYRAWLHAPANPIFN